MLCVKLSQVCSCVQFEDEVREEMEDIIQNKYTGIDDFSIEGLLLNYVMFHVSVRPFQVSVKVFKASVRVFQVSVRIFLVCARMFLVCVRMFQVSVRMFHVSVSTLCKIVTVSAWACSSSAAV